jgi:TatA/E family protein of Tat protein translocase
VEGLFAPWHILVVLVIALLVLGPKELPRAGRQFARTVGEVRRFREALQREAHGLFDETSEPTPDANPGPRAVEGADHPKTDGEGT